MEIRGQGTKMKIDNMENLWLIGQLLVSYNLLLPMALYLFFIVKRNKDRSVVINENIPDYAIIVTAYRQSDLLPAAIESILRMNYENYHIYVVADNCEDFDLQLSDSRITILRPKTVLASNTKSHFYAISHFIRAHEILTIIDSDNLVHTEYINELNKFFAKGYQAVQGRREAKNLNTTIACLDAARDNFYDFYDGEVLFRLGSSATLAGSGMAFKTELYMRCLESLKISGAGFDKVLQAEIVKKGCRIAHASKAIVYDEKTTHSKQLVHQRSRWINSWFKYFGYGCSILWLGIKGRNVNQILFGCILLRPPLFLFILLSLICTVINLFIAPKIVILWFLGFVIFTASFFIGLKRQNTRKEVYTSLSSIPKFIYYQLVSLYYMRVANKRSVATIHSNHNTISYDKE